MDVRVDQPRHQSAVAEIDYLCTRWALHRGAGLSNSLALDEDLAGLDDLSRFYVQQSGRAKDDRMRLRPCRLGDRTGDANKENRESEDDTLCHGPRW